MKDIPRTLPSNRGLNLLLEMSRFGVSGIEAHYPYEVNEEIIIFTKNWKNRQASSFKHRTFYFL
jgi:hypothetical protein